MHRIETKKTAPGQNIKRSVRLSVVMLCCWISCQCSLQPIPRDLAVYVNRDIYGIVELEKLAIERYAGLTGENYVSDRILKESLDAEIIPAYTRFTLLINRIKPRTDPVQKLHAIYCEAAVSRLQGFRTVLLAIKTQDSALVRQANRMLKHGHERILLWQSRLAELAEPYGLELN